MAQSTHDISSGTSGVVPTEEAQGTSAGPIARPEQWVDDYGDLLFRYAQLRLRDPGWAEDVVQETFLSAWKARHRYAGLSSEKNWLFGILKNKIADHLRRLAREISFTDLEFQRDEQKESFHSHGLARDCWIPGAGPRPWKDPEQCLERDEFWKALHACVSKLPRTVARVFLMREMELIKSEEICQSLEISPNHLWVMLHRARMALRRCLERHWFERDDPETK